MNGMTLNAKSVLAGASLGLAVGAGAGFLLARRFYLGSFKNEIEQTLAAITHYREVLAASEREDNHAVERPEAAVGDTGITPTVGDTGVRPYGDLLPVLPSSGDPLEGFPLEENDPGYEETSGDSSPDSILERDRSKPYIISLAEFQDDEPDYSKLSITYYEADKVLVDDREVPIRDVAGTSGKDFAHHFGHGSADPNIVYVRNERLGVDFEIAKDERGYSEVVLDYGRPK